MTGGLVVTAITEALKSLRRLGLNESHDKVTTTSIHELIPTDSVVLAAVPAWWKVQAEAVRLNGEWVNVTKVFGATPPMEIPDDPLLENFWGAMKAEQVETIYAAIPAGTFYWRSANE